MRLVAACSTQWRRCAATGALLGLDYPGVQAAAGWLGVAVDGDLFARLRALEAEVIRLLDSSDG